MTVIVPVIEAWIAQWNGYVPAVLKVRPPARRSASVSVPQSPSSSVAVWFGAPSFVNATTSPTLARDGRRREREVLDRDRHGAGVAGRRARAASTGGAAGRRPALGAVVAAPPPQAARASIENRPRATDARRIMCLLPVRAAAGRRASLSGYVPARYGFALAYGTRRRYRCPMRRTRTVLHGVDEPTMRRLLIHEARVHALPGREIRDLGDAILLHDPVDPEPFWNRAEAIRWPADPDAFDRRLAELLVLFTSLVRQPHIWPAPLHDTPDDLVARLEANGFRDVGGGSVMVLRRSATRARQRAAAPLAAGHPRSSGSTARRRAGAGTRPPTSCRVLLDAFGVEPDRRAGDRGGDGRLARPRGVHLLPASASMATRRRSPGGRRSTARATCRRSGRPTWARGWGLGEP